jgi:cytochrome oxidase assembly protein ShyY1
VRRLWVRWALLIAFVVALGAVFVNLGGWQLDRLEQRRERNANTVNNGQAGTAAAADVFVRPIEETDQWRRVRAAGTFDADHQFVVRYRQNADAEGYQVVTPLRTDFGAVLVDRGFVPLPRGVAIPSVAPAPPAGTVSVEGYVRRNEQGGSGAVQPENGQVRLINSDALQTALPYPIENGYLSALSTDPPQSGGFKPILPPELNEGPHFWYAVQWFMFAGIGILGIVVFIRADLRERRLARAGAASGRSETSTHQSDQQPNERGREIHDGGVRRR